MNTLSKKVPQWTDGWDILTSAKAPAQFGRPFFNPFFSVAGHPDEPGRAVLADTLFEQPPSGAPACARASPVPSAGLPHRSRAGARWVIGASRHAGRRPGQAEGPVAEAAAHVGLVFLLGKPSPARTRMLTFAGKPQGLGHERPW